MSIFNFFCKLMTLFYNLFSLSYSKSAFRAFQVRLGPPNGIIITWILLQIIMYLYYISIVLLYDALVSEKNTAVVNIFSLAISIKVRSDTSLGK